jgi:hypothetical protein
MGNVLFLSFLFFFFNVNGKKKKLMQTYHPLQTEDSVVDRYICLVVTVEAISSALKCMQMMANGRAAKLL